MSNEIVPNFQWHFNNPTNNCNSYRLPLETKSRIAPSWSLQPDCAYHQKPQTQTETVAKALRDTKTQRADEMVGDRADLEETKGHVCMTGKEPKKAPKKTDCVQREIAVGLLHTPSPTTKSNNPHSVTPTCLLLRINAVKAAYFNVGAFSKQQCDFAQGTSPG